MVSLKSRTFKNKKRSLKMKRGGSVSSDMVTSLISKNGTGTNNDVQAMHQSEMMEGKLPDKVLNVLTKEFIPSPTNQIHKMSGGSQRHKLKQKQEQKFSKEFLQNIIKNINGGKKEHSVLGDMKKSWKQYNNFALTDKNSKIMFNDLMKANKGGNKKSMKGAKHRKNKHNNKKSMKGGFKGFLPEHWFTTGGNIPQNKPMVDTIDIESEAIQTNEINNNVRVGDCPQPKTLPPLYKQNTDYTHQTESCMNTLATEGQSGGGGIVHGADSDANSWRFMPWNEDTNMTGYRDGGDSALGGTAIPETGIQKISGHLDGTKPILAPSDGDVTVPNNSNMFCEKGSCLNTDLLPDKIPNQTNKMPDIEMGTAGRPEGDFTMEETTSEMSGGKRKNHRKKK